MIIMIISVIKIKKHNTVIWQLFLGTFSCISLTHSCEDFGKFQICGFKHYYLFIYLKAYISFF